MRRRSLAVRLALSATVWSVIALVAAGLILTSLYRQAIERAFDERLGLNLTALIGSLAQQDPGALRDPGNLGEQRFDVAYSGWYWQVRRRNPDRVVLASPSLFNDVLGTDAVTEQTDTAGVRGGTLRGPDDELLRALARTITFGPDEVYEVVVAGDAGEAQADVLRFRRNVFLTLAVFGVGLILATTMQIRWGLRPLDRVRAGLSALRSGKETRFEGRFPAEIEPLARELNALLDSNQQIVERARTQVGNLAHALKTPLSVITNEARAGRGPLAEKVTEQAEIMRTQVNHYLERARIAARSKVIGVITDVEPAVASLIRAMRRIHEDRHLEISANIPAGARFKGERQDLEEIVGNLVDNACKWARHRVSITADYDRPAEGRSPGMLRLRIDDDGPGMTDREGREATRRGRRLDETKPGSGLGLSIVTDLVALYEGAFSLQRSPYGGVRAEIELPAA